MIGTTKKVYANDSHWVGSPSGGSGDADDQLIIANRDKVQILAEVSDPAQDYSYDDTAVCYLRGHGYFIIQASGCSCTGPSETWGVVKRFKTRKQVMKAIEDGEYQGYTLPEYAINDLRTQLLDE